MAGHHHKPKSEVKTRNLLLATGLNLIISFAELAGGIISGSLALLSDALHNFGDAVATLIAYIATILSKKKTSSKHTFGLKRTEILAALLNSIILIVVSIYLFFEAYKRWKNPVEIDSRIMLIVAMIGLLANIYAVLLLRKDSKKSLNVRAAYIHLIGDSLSSVVVIIGGLMIMFFKIYWVDPLITVLIGIYILKETISILSETITILMQNTPKGLNIKKIKKEIEILEEVENIHHIHAWSLTDSQIYFEAHIDTLNDLRLSDVSTIREKIFRILHEEFNIDHVTLQFEYKVLDDKELIHSD